MPSSPPLGDPSFRVSSRVFKKSCRWALSRWIFATSLLPTICAQSPTPEQGSISSSGKFNVAGESEPAASRAESEKQLLDSLTGKPDSEGRIKLGKITIDPKQRSLSFPGTLNQRDGIVEYALVHEKGKIHEALLKTAVTPRELHVALLLLKAKPTTAVSVKPPSDSAIRVYVEWETNGPRIRHPLEDLLKLVETPDDEGLPLSSGPWDFTGSGFTRKGYIADSEGSIISLIEDPTCVLNNPRDSKKRDDLHHPRTDRLPTALIPLTIVFQLSNP